jgi:hypothetical protein
MHGAHHLVGSLLPQLDKSLLIVRIDGEHIDQSDNWCVDADDGLGQVTPFLRGLRSG